MDPYYFPTTARKRTLSSISDVQESNSKKPRAMHVDNNTYDLTHSPIMHTVMIPSPSTTGWIETVSDVEEGSYQKTASNAGVDISHGPTCVSMNMINAAWLLTLLQMTLTRISVKS